MIEMFRAERDREEHDSGYRRGFEDGYNGREHPETFPANWSQARCDGYTKGFIAGVQNADLARKHGRIK